MSTLNCDFAIFKHRKSQICCSYVGNRKTNSLNGLPRGRKYVKPQIGMYITENWDSFKLPFVVWVQYGSPSFKLFSNDKFAAYFASITLEKNVSSFYILNTPMGCGLWEALPWKHTWDKLFRFSFVTLGSTIVTSRYFFFIIFMFVNIDASVNFVNVLMFCYPTHKEYEYLPAYDRRLCAVL